jgi:hypothetical protein
MAFWIAPDMSAAEALNRFGRRQFDGFEAQFDHRFPVVSVQLW